MTNTLEELRTISLLSPFPVLSYCDRVGDYLVGWLGVVMPYSLAMLFAGTATGIYPTPTMKLTATQEFNRLARCGLVHVPQCKYNPPNYRDAFSAVHSVLMAADPGFSIFLTNNAQEILRRLEIPEKELDLLGE